MMTQGTPGSATPITFSPGAFKCTEYQIDGMPQSRCGSLARIGLPVEVCLPETAHAFEPGCTSRPDRDGNRKFTLSRSPPTSICCFWILSLQEEVNVRYIWRPTRMESISLQGRGW